MASFPLQTLSTPVERRRHSFADVADVDEFVAMLERFERGEISPDAWRAFRLVRGTYGQRQEDAQMLRVKIPQGVLTATQVESIADVAERYARGFAHVTTRQNVQFHFLALADVETVMRRFVDEGITTREACGNSVRNITACPFAGVAADEAFDVTPYAEALTRFLLRHPLAAILPRKFKIAFEGCGEDHALASINDLGWTAAIAEVDGVRRRGFRLTVGGGTSIMPVSGRPLFEFLPAGEMLDVAEAIVRIYHRLGDHQHRQRNRMKFLIKSLGWERWRSAVLEELARVRAEGGRRLPFDPDAAPIETPPDRPRPAAPGPVAIRELVERATVRGPGLLPLVAPASVVPGRFARWRQTNTRPQRQPGFEVVFVRLRLGDIAAGQLRALAALSRAYGDGTVRLTLDQNVFLRWVPATALEDLFAGLSAAGLAEPDAATIADITSCPGAESCRLAVTQSRGLGQVLGDTLARRPDLVERAAAASIKISGCPNGCGQHHVATLGFQGSVRKVDGRAVPQYFVMVGGDAGPAGARFARLAAKVPARRVGAALERLLEWYVRTRADGESPRAFFARASVADVKALLADLEAFSTAEASPVDYIDLGESTAFTPEVLEGECAT
jgi:sulfite reductase (NADPH) hemoprotein beta-component